jgi:eukaryotic translation initiation factor 2-alpha kinase 4
VFFEMNWPPFGTSTERIQVIQRLRLPAIIFPEEWEGRERQKTIITRLLQHNPAARPSALELSNSNLLPEQEEDAYFEEARRKIREHSDIRRWTSS